MLIIRRQAVIEKMKKASLNNYRSRKSIMNNAYRGDGSIAMAFLVKREYITFTKEELRSEINEMVEASLITILQWEGLMLILDGAENAEKRVTTFLRKKRRIIVE